MVKLQIDVRRMHWFGRKNKMGNRLQRHDLGRFMRRYTKRLPVEIWVTRSTTSRREFGFSPILVNGHSKNIVFTYKKFIAVVSFEDVVDTVQSYVMNNNLFSQEIYHYNC